MTGKDMTYKGKINFVLIMQVIKGYQLLQKYNWMK